MGRASFFIVTIFAFAALNTKAQDPLGQFLPKGYVLFDSARGDLNADGLSDLVCMIKGTDPAYVVTDEYKGKLDRNRRGLIILLRQKSGYRKLLENRECFSSENEDGGVYFPPDLTIEISKRSLLIHYGHGRYGYWEYQFSYKENDLELIGFIRSENSGPVKNREISMNFLTGKKKIMENTNEDSKGEDEVFKTTWETFRVEKRIKLSAVKDFDELHPDHPPTP